MISREEITIKLRDRLDRKCTAIELTHWAKGLMFDCFENKNQYDPDHKDLLERAIVRIANSSTNYRTFLFNGEITRLLPQLGDEEKVEIHLTELYTVSVIMGQQDSEEGREAVNTIAQLIPEDKNLYIRRQGSGIVLTANNMSEEEIHKLAESLQSYNFLISLRDYMP